MNFDAPNRILRQGLAAGYYSAASYAIARRGETLAIDAIGKTNFSANAADVSPETLFDAASLTKPVVTATLILQLVEQGRVTLRQSIGKALEPEFGPAPHLNGVEIRRLLTHTSGLSPVPKRRDDAYSSSRVPCRNSILEDSLNTPLLREPGAGYTYSDVGYILLAQLASLITDTPLDELASSQIFEPLGLRSTTFRPNPAEFQLASTDMSLAPGEVHDPRARIMDGLAGHAGMFTTAADMLKFAETIRKGGAPILSRASTDKMRATQIPSETGGMSYGFFCSGNDLLPSGDLFSDRSFGHSGFTGCLILIDPAYDASVALLTNRVLGDYADGAPFLKLRRAWLNTIAAAIT
jgi:CubicO group peptidase (beta-lactamase class C family)